MTPVLVKGVVDGGGVVNNTVAGKVVIADEV